MKVDGLYDLMLSVSREILICLRRPDMANEAVVGGAGAPVEKGDSVFKKAGDFLKPFVPGMSTTKQKIGAAATGLLLVGVGVGIDKCISGAKKNSVQPTNNAKSV